MKIMIELHDDQNDLGKETAQIVNAIFNFKDITHVACKAG